MIRIRRAELVLGEALDSEQRDPDLVDRRRLTHSGEGSLAARCARSDE
jgi:hypothetical protein